MGCGSSKSEGLQTVDDSVHVMLKHDKKVAQGKGEAPKGYVPRAPHPLLQQQQQQQTDNGGGGSNTETTAGTGGAPERKPVVATEEDDEPQQ